MDLVIERLRALSAPEQEALAGAIEEMLGQSALTPEQWADVEADPRRRRRRTLGA